LKSKGERMQIMGKTDKKYEGNACMGSNCWKKHISKNYHKKQRGRLLKMLVINVK